MIKYARISQTQTQNHKRYLEQCVEGQEWVWNYSKYKLLRGPEL
jgi:hypothetical protein